jgi:flagellar hook-associated protein 2
MSSPTSALSSLGSGSSSTTVPTYFTGMTNFSSSLNAAISQEVQIAGLPIQLLQNNVNDLTNQQSELNTLNGDVTAVQTAVASLASAAGSMLYGTVSDVSATATVTSGATAGSYLLQVTNLGSYSNALSNDGLTTVTNPASQNVSASGHYTLTVTVGTGTPVATPISYSGGNLNGLAQAINNANAGVQATVVDVGSNSAPDYRLSLESDNLGPVTMQLNDGQNGGGTNLMTASGPAGVLAQYSVMGKPVQSNSDTVTLAPGVTLHLKYTNSSAATVTVAADPTNVGTTLNNFVTAYNKAMSELNNNRGQTPVALAGESIVYQLSNDLQNLANYAGGSGNISSLQALGVEFQDTTGQLSFNQSTFDAATSGQTDALTQFLGSTSGGGFLETATNALTNILDPNTGVLTQATGTLQSQINSVNSQMTQKEAAVTLLQQNLTQQMAAADTMIYSLQQQESMLQSMFTTEQAANMLASTL